MNAISNASGGRIPVPALPWFLPVDQSGLVAAGVPAETDADRVDQKRTGHDIPQNPAATRDDGLPALFGVWLGDGTGVTVTDLVASDPDASLKLPVGDSD